MTGRLHDKQARIASVLDHSVVALGAPSPAGGAAALRRELVARLFDAGLRVREAQTRVALRSHDGTVRFREAYGATPHAFVEQHRMAAAARLLREGDIEIYLIASAVGYAHPETFLRAFRRVYGVTPAAYRRRLAAEAPATV